VMLFVSFVSSNLLAVLSFLLAIQVSLGVG
jgi:hypothetical protein